MPALPALHSTAAAFHPAEREQSIRAKTATSRALYARACESLAGGVSSGLRRSARPYPLYFDHGLEATLVDADGNTYLDYTLGWGPNILGNAPGVVAEAMAGQARRSLTFGAQHNLEIEVAELLRAAIPCAESVCFANSGTEIVQVALRLARAATDRMKYLKFEGHYHGWADSVLVSYHPSREQIDISGGAPVSVGTGQLPPTSVVVAQWNDVDSVERAFRDHPDAISCILCEPLLANSGCIPAAPGFLAFLREIANRHGALLIFDEVITGFRLALGGAQERYGVEPDLATFGKAIGGGVAFSALAGKRRYMDLIASGQVVHAGTLNGNPVCLAAAKATLEALSRDNGSVYDRLEARALTLRRGLESILREQGLTVASNGDGAVFHLAFMDRPARNYRDLLAADHQKYSDFALALLDEGVLVLPDGRWYISVAHTDADIENTLAAARRAAD